MFNKWRSLGSSLWILRRLLRNQEAQLLETRRLAQACERIAAALHVRNASGFVTGAPIEGDDPSDRSGLVRTSDQELAELVGWEAELTRQLGRSPTDDEVVAAWTSWKEGMGA